MLCVLCGSPYAETDTHCPGPRCGAGLDGQRYGDASYAVQAWCEPREAAAEPGETVVVTLTLRNSGALPDRCEPGLAPETARRTGLDRPGTGDVLPGEERVWTLVYTVPEDAGGVEGAGPHGDADASDDTEWHDVEVDVVSAADPRITARAVFSLQVPGGFAGAVAAPGFAGGAAAYGADERGSRGRRGGGKRRIGVAAGVACAVVLAVIAGFAMAGSDEDDGGERAPVAAGGSSAASGSAGPTSTSDGAEDPSGGATASEGEPSASTAKASETSSATPSATRTTTKPTTAAPSTTRPRATSATPPPATTTPPPDKPAPPPPSPTSKPTKTDDGTTVVPKLYGLLVSEAQAAVKQAGLVLEPHYYDARYGEGGPFRYCRVWEFTPGEGARVPKGTVIDISRVYGCG
ncbi:PASTA domain-containing protein [Yinghuangia sp. YIM S09857]|uniref:PASTA domain-containing protein n=1 Tax=Yinghuangia sp. YIM S09857 TaxID=3436929 RepID=UPI003F53E062